MNPDAAEKQQIHCHILRHCRYAIMLVNVCRMFEILYFYIEIDLASLYLCSSYVLVIFNVVRLITAVDNLAIIQK